MAEIVTVTNVLIFPRRLDERSKSIVRYATINLHRSPAIALEATGRVLYVNDEIVKKMPKAEKVEAEAIFLKVSRLSSDEDLEFMYKRWELSPIDPYSLAGINEEHSLFADEYPNATHWKDEEGNWCFAAFCLKSGEPTLHIDRSSGNWSDCWWLAGVRN